MNDLRKAAEMALGALMQRGEHHPKVYQAAEALRQALDDKPPVKTYAGGKPNYCTPEVTGEVTGDVDAVNMSQERVDETAKGEHEPVAWANAADLQNFDMRVRTNRDHYHTVPLYTSPPKKEWVGLTEEEIKKIAKKHKWHGGNVEPHLMSVFRSLEAKLKEKNGG